jgi:hypothetical protein
VGDVGKCVGAVVGVLEGAEDGGDVAKSAISSMNTISVRVRVHVKESLNNSS